MNAGIYVHLPFCKVRCAYCDFPLTTRLSLSQRYYTALLREIALNPSTRCADTLYFGGGTPSLTPPEIILEIKRRFLLEKDAEVTLEANPDDIEQEIAQTWKQIGITRLSIGVQSLEELVLHGMLRQHSAARALDAFRLARNAGFENINVDLIAGYPQQTVRGFLDGVQTLMELRPDHFSIYLLETDHRTALARQLDSGKVQLMPEEDQLHCFAEAIRYRQDTGYCHYEVSNFALPGLESRHNLKYWSDAPYHAYGAGACSYVEPIRTTNFSGVIEYVEALETGKLPVQSSTVEDRDTRIRNALIFGLRKRDGIHLPEFERRYGVPAVSLFPANAKEFFETGLLEIRGTHLRLTFSGMMVSNDILHTVL